MLHKRYSLLEKYRIEYESIDELSKGVFSLTCTILMRLFVINIKTMIHNIILLQQVRFAMLFLNSLLNSFDIDN